MMTRLPKVMGIPTVQPALFVVAVGHAAALSEAGPSTASVCTSVLVDLTKRQLADRMIAGANKAVGKRITMQKVYLFILALLANPLYEIFADMVEGLIKRA